MALTIRFVLATLVVAAASLVAKAAMPVRIVCFGDSVTKAVRAGVKPNETFSALLQRSLSTSGRPVEVINAGVGGNTTSDGLARFERDVLARDPQYVVIMFGLNDSWIDEGKTDSRVSPAQYRDNLRRMIATLKERGITPVLMTPNPAIAPKYSPQRNVTLKSYVDVVRDLARHEQIELSDVYGRFSELAVEGVELNSLFTDAMHPNPAGQKLIADWLAPRLEALLEPKQR